MDSTVSCNVIVHMVLKFLVIDHYHLPAGSDGYNWCAALFFSGLPEESIIKKTAFVFHHPFEH